MQATGDSAYLQDANDFYILHLYSETGGPTTLAVDWSEYFWSSNVLLASLTDGPAFHQRTQYFFRQWICSYGQVGLTLMHLHLSFCASPCWAVGCAWDCAVPWEVEAPRARSTSARMLWSS